MYKNKYIFILFLFGFLMNCTQGEKPKEMDFPLVISLEGFQSNVSDVYLKYPFRVRIQDSFLYVMDLHPTDFYGHKFKYPSLAYCGSFMERGEAPEGFLDAENIRLDNQGFLWALDANKKKIVRFTKNIGDPSAKTVHLEEALIRTLDFDLYNDSTFIVPDYTGEYRINLVNLQGKIIHRAFHIPIKGRIQDGSSLNALAQAWRPFLSYHSEHGILAMVTQLGQVLEIYNLKKESVINIVRYKDNEPQFITKGGYAIPTGIMGYSDVHVGKEHIYALFWGHSFANLKNGKITKEGGNTVHVFTLDGTPKIEYKLDSHITGFHIDEANKCIIGLDVNSNQPLKMFQYD